MLFGVILDPAIDSLVVVSDKTGKEIQAEIIDSEPIPFRLWCAQIPVKQGEAFTVTALGARKVPGTKTRDFWDSSIRHQTQVPLLDDGSKLSLFDYFKRI
ncbi:hypothetical protein [Brevibacillus parabrevis]|uniref:hypothetical protein n=1 Tax=Brevibacillus parabrevis TaxID=54914 RepID=UPI0028D5F088|nr:hypothetical protein [Brevibacillus parabrevis]